MLDKTCNYKLTGSSTIKQNWHGFGKVLFLFTNPATIRTFLASDSSLSIVVGYSSKQLHIEGGIGKVFSELLNHD